MTVFHFKSFSNGISARDKEWEVVERVGSFDEIGLIGVFEESNNNNFVVFFGFVGGISISELDSWGSGFLVDPVDNFVLLSSATVFESVFSITFEPF